MKHILVKTWLANYSTQLRLRILVVTKTAVYDQNTAEADENIILLEYGQKVKHKGHIMMIKNVHPC